MFIMSKSLKPKNQIWYNPDIVDPEPKNLEPSITIPGIDEPGHDPAFPGPIPETPEAPIQPPLPGRKDIPEKDPNGPDYGKDEKAEQPYLIHNDFTSVKEDRVDNVIMANMAALEIMEATEGTCYADTVNGRVAAFSDYYNKREQIAQQYVGDKDGYEKAMKELDENTSPETRELYEKVSEEYDKFRKEATKEGADLDAVYAKYPTAAYACGRTDADTYKEQSGKEIDLKGGPVVTATMQDKSPSFSLPEWPYERKDPGLYYNNDPTMAKQLAPDAPQGKGDTMELRIAEGKQTFDDVGKKAPELPQLDGDYHETAKEAPEAKLPQPEKIDFKDTRRDPSMAGLNVNFDTKTDDGLTFA